MICNCITSYIGRKDNHNQRYSDKSFVSSGFDACILKLTFDSVLFIKLFYYESEIQKKKTKVFFAIIPSLNLRPIDIRNTKIIGISSGTVIKARLCCHYYQRKTNLIYGGCSFVRLYNSRFKFQQSQHEICPCLSLLGLVFRTSGLIQ